MVCVPRPSKKVTEGKVSKEKITGVPKKIHGRDVCVERTDKVSEDSVTSDTSPHHHHTVTMLTFMHGRIQWANLMRSTATGRLLHNAIPSQSSRLTKAEKGQRAVCPEESSDMVHSVTVPQSSFIQGWGHHLHKALDWGMGFRDVWSALISFEIRSKN